MNRPFLSIAAFAAVFAVAAIAPAATVESPFTLCSRMENRLATGDGITLPSAERELVRFAGIVDLAASEENKNMKSKLIALSVCAATATCLAGRQLLPEGFAPDPSSFALLPHDHSFYWAAMAASTNWYQDLMMNEVLVRTNDVLSFEREYPIDTNMTMCAFFSSERELTLREGVLALIWDEEGTNALPFFASVISSPGWPFSDRFCAYRHLSDVPRYWEDEPRHGMTSNEVSAIRETIESVMHAETNWSCRTECDRFFLATDPVWKTSEVRRAYLEETLLRAGSDPLQIWNTQNRLNKLSTPYDPEYLDYMRRNNIML